MATKATTSSPCLQMDIKYNIYYKQLLRFTHFLLQGTLTTRHTIYGKTLEGKHSQLQDKTSVPGKSFTIGFSGNSIPQIDVEVTWTVIRTKVNLCIIRV